LPDTVKAHATNTALRLCASERLRVFPVKFHFLKPNHAAILFKTANVVQFKVLAAKVTVPVNAVIVSRAARH